MIFLGREGKEALPKYLLLKKKKNGLEAKRVETAALNQGITE